MDAQAQLLFDKLDVNGDGEDLLDFKSLFSSKRFNASRTSGQHMQETSLNTSKSPQHVQQQAAPPCMSDSHIPDSQIPYEPPMFLQQQMTVTSCEQSVIPAIHTSPHQAISNATYSGSFSANAGEVTTSSASGPFMARFQAGETALYPGSAMLQSSATMMLQPSSPAMCVTSAPQPVKATAVMSTQQTSFQPPQHSAPQSVPQPSQPTKLSVEPTSAKSAQTFSASIAPSSLPQPSAQAITGAIGPLQVAPLQMASAQMAPQPQQIVPQPQQMAPQQVGSGIFPQEVAAPVMTYEGPSPLQMASFEIARQPQHMARQQMGSGMFSHGVAASVMTYEASASQMSSPSQMAPPQVAPQPQQIVSQQLGSGMFPQGAASQSSSPPHIAPPQVAPQLQQMAPQQMGSGMFSQGASASVMTYEASASQMSSPQMGPQQMAPLQMMLHPQQTTQWQTGSGMFSQGAAAPVMTYETPASQVPSSSVNFPALQADTVTESKPGSRASGRHTAIDKDIRNKFKNRVVEAVSHGEEMITIPTKMVIGLLEMVLPESDCADLKPLKVTKSRSKGGCCCDF